VAAITQASLLAYRVLVGKSGGRRPLGRLVVDGRIILARIFRKSVGRAWILLIWLRIGTSGGLL